MTNEETNIACALKLGWTQWENEEVHILGATGPKFIYLPPEGKTVFDQRPLPNFAGDLNLCASLRASLTEEEKREYANRIAMEVTRKEMPARHDDEMLWWMISNATAEQIARTYLAAKTSNPETV